MSVELKVFNGNLAVKDKALKKEPTLKHLAISVRAKNKGSAAIIIAGKFAELYPDNIDDYFAAKVWEHREGLPAINADFGFFCSEYFESVAVWDTNKGEPISAPSKTKYADSTEDYRQETSPPAERMTPVKELDLTYRAYCLVMFGPVEEVSASQRGQMLDVYNDDYDVIHPLREQAEAITKEPRVLSIPSEKQSECLAWVRRNARQDAKWPDYKNLFTKWLDAAQEACTETESVGKDETKPSAPDETDLPAVCPGRAAELDKELNDTFEKREPAPLTNREMEIAFALNDLIFGRTIIMNEGEAASVIACTGHLIPQVIALLMADITITELHLAPDFSDEEIQDVATTTLDAWSDDPNIRQQVMLDAIVEYRKPSPSKSSAPVSTSQPGNDAEPEQIIASSPTALTYRQQLTIAALNGLCANPAYYHARNSLPLMAIDLANDVIDMQDGVDAD